MKVSVIVPIYNVELYLERCIQSIINQSYNNLEILLIDDGSTDNSLYIAKKYEGDPRVKVFQKENGGASSARNFGLDKITGDVVTFVDSDDWLSEDIYKHVMDLFSEYHTDVVDYVVESKESHEDKENKLQQEERLEIIDEHQILEDYLLKGQTEKTPFSVCRKVFKTKLVQSVRFRENMINEDIVFNFEVLKNAKKLIHTTKVGYYYFQSPNSVTRNGLRKKDFDLLKASELLKEMSRNESKRVNYLVDVKHARSYFSLLAKISFYGFADDSLDKTKVIKDLTKNLRDNFFLLMKSPLPLNRKIMIVALCIDMRILQLPLSIYKSLKGKKND